MHGIPSFLQSIAPAALGPAAFAAGLAVSFALCAATVATVARRPAGPQGDERASWALACAAAVIASPHVFAYDLALLLWPAALLIDLGATRRARLALLGAYAVTWTAALRAPLAAHGWPAAILAASWTSPWLLLAWQELRRAARPRAAP
jgi:hypothetical protein